MWSSSNHQRSNISHRPIEKTFTLVMTYLILLPFLLHLTYYSQEVDGLSCFRCGQSPCENRPRCCESGSYTGDICGCCKTCAKAGGDPCGGPWRSQGVCGYNHSCLRVCGLPVCQGENQELCKFPFLHNGKFYDGCTTDFGEFEGSNACPTRVFGDLTADLDSLILCNPDCPVDGELNTESHCEDTFNYDGVCIHNTTREILQAVYDSDTDKKYAPKKKYTISFDDGISETDPSPLCVGPRRNENSLIKCRCEERPADSTEISEGEHCKPFSYNEGGHARSWCFLENIDNPEKPTDKCFSDVQWSVTNGRFWSNDACNEQLIAPLPPPIVFKDEIIELRDSSLGGALQNNPV